MPATTWLNRLIDESNTWFLAVKSEDASRFIDAVIYYLKDATECLRKHLELQAALSCASAASCLEKTGDSINSSRLYREAAAIYLDNSKLIGKSTKERLWSLERAYYFSLMAHDTKKAGEVHNELLSVQFENAISKSNSNSASTIQAPTDDPPEPGKNVQSKEVMASIDDFLNARRKLPRLQPISAGTADR